MKNIQDELIAKYLNKELSEFESNQLADWLNEDKAHQDFLFGLEELYWADQIDEMRKPADTDNEWKKIEESILRSPAVIMPARRQALIRRFLKYAAVFIVAAAIPSLLWLGSFRQHRNMTEPANYATIVAPKGQRSQLILPDGTKVWINSASSLAYDMSSGSERRLKLSGEAYFEVAKDMNRPFIVETSMLNIKVLGTEFNLRSFDEEGLVEATLYEGSIAANTPAGDFEQDILLKPGQRLVFTNAKKLDVASIENTYDRSWREGIHHFRGQPLGSITRSLERTFDVEITITDSDLVRQTFTCEFEHAETLHDILEVLRMTKRVTYQINENKVIISPTNK